MSGYQVILVCSFFRVQKSVSFKKRPKKASFEHAGRLYFSSLYAWHRAGRFPAVRMILSD